MRLVSVVGQFGWSVWLVSEVGQCGWSVWLVSVFGQCGWSVRLVSAVGQLSMCLLVPCAGLEFDPKPGPQLAVRVQARPRPAN